MPRMYFATVRAETLNPNLASSAWIRFCPHRKFSVAMRRMSAFTSGGIVFRPDLPRCRDRQRQWAFHPLRCHPSTVPGVTIKSDFRQRGNHRDARIQNRRSGFCNRGRGRLRCRTRSCCLRQRFSATSDAFDLKNAAIAHTTQRFGQAPADGQPKTGPTEAACR